MPTYTHDFQLTIDDVEVSYEVATCPHMHIKPTNGAELTLKQSETILQLLEVIKRLDNCSDSVSKIEFTEK